MSLGFAIVQSKWFHSCIVPVLISLNSTNSGFVWEVAYSFGHRKREVWEDLKSENWKPGIEVFVLP